MNALVTGANGFVGRYLMNHLTAQGFTPISGGRLSETCDVVIELGDYNSLEAAIERCKPDLVFHLAAQTFVPEAAEHPLESYDTNALGTARLLQAIVEYNRRNAKSVKVVFASSAQVYGRGNDVHGALDEMAPLVPLEPYSASKAAAEHFCVAAHHTYGLHVVVARSFNHIGIGQDTRFVVSGFARRLAAVANGIEPPTLEVGNLEAERDFLDVRDVVEAYICLAKSGASGTAYNVCSGQPLKIKAVLASLIRAAGVPIEVREDAEKMRPVDIPRFYGKNERLRSLGWTQLYPIEQSLREIYAYAKEHASATAWYDM